MSALFSSLLPINSRISDPINSRNSDPGSHIIVVGSSPPLPTTVRAVHFYLQKGSALSSHVESRRIVLTHAITGALDSCGAIQLKKSIPTFETLT